jgi:hypothetical protein
MNLTIIIDIFIDAYVMVRFIQILQNNNYHHYYYNNSLKFFNLILYWNILTILLSFFYHSIIGLNISIKLNNLFFIIYLIQISLSYLITIDTEFKVKKINLNSFYFI